MVAPPPGNVPPPSPYVTPAPPHGGYGEPLAPTQNPYVAPRNLAPPAPPNLFTGALQMPLGLLFLLSRPSLYGVAAVPLFVAAGISTVGMIAGWFAAAGIVAPHLVDAAPVAAAALHVGQALLFLAFALFVVLVGAALAQPLSGPALERLVLRTEEGLSAPRAPTTPEPLAARIFRSLKVNLVGLVFAVLTLGPLAILTFLFPPISVVTVPLKFCATALVVAWDFLDYPLEGGGGGVRARLRWFLDHFGAAFGFGLAATGMLLLPFVGLLVLPAGVVGATHLVVRADLAEGNPHRKMMGT